jgi:hypothetical protein
MGTFAFPKPMSDVSDAILLPKDWYNVEITEDPTIEPNKVLKELAGAKEVDLSDATDETISQLLSEDEKAGYNLVVKMKTEDPDPRYTNYPLTLWLSFPTKADENKFYRGQSQADSKQQRIAAFIKAFGGQINKDGTFDLYHGMKGKIMVVQGQNPQTGEFTNSVDSFSGFMKYEG